MRFLIAFRDLPWRWIAEDLAALAGLAAVFFLSLLFGWAVQ